MVYNKIQCIQTVNKILEKKNYKIFHNTEHLKIKQITEAKEIKQNR